MTDQTWMCRVDGCSGTRTDDGGLVFGALLGLQNNSAAAVFLKRVFIEMVHGMNTPGSELGGSPQHLYRTTAQAGGEAITEIKHDTNASSLPAQVSVAVNPVVTFSDNLGSVGEMAGMRFSGTPGGVNFFSGRTHGRWNIAQYWNCQAGQVQPIVLREGQGFMWYQDLGAISHIQFIEVVVREQSGGTTHMYRTKAAPATGVGPMIGVFNGSGSGVILEIQVLVSQDVGLMATHNPLNEFQSTLSPMSGVRLLRCSSVADGEVVTPVARDTANTALPSGLTFYRNPIVVPESYGGGGPGTGTTWAELLTGPVTVTAQAQLMRDQLGSVVTASWLDSEPYWAPGGSDFPFVLAPIRTLFSSRDGGLEVRQGQAAALAWGWRVIVPDDVLAAGPYLDDQTVTNAMFTVVFEFTVVPGAGGTQSFIPTSVIGTPIS